MQDPVSTPEYELATDKLLPHNIEAEENLLTHFLIGIPVFDTVPKLRPDHFFRQSHAQLFQAILTLQERGERITAVTVAHESNVPLSTIQGIIGRNEYPPARTADYDSIIRQTYAQRRVVQLGQEIFKQGHSPNTSLKDVRYHMERAMEDFMAEEDEEEDQELTRVFTILDDPPQPPQWLVDGLMVDQGVSILFGTWGGGKTLLAMSAALSIIAPGPFNAQQFPTVLYVDHESARGSFHQRVRAIASGLGIPDHVASGIVYLKAPDLASHAARIRKAILTESVSAVIIDSATSSGFDPMNPIEVDHIYKAMHSFGVPVLLIAHPPKNATGLATSVYGVQAWTARARYITEYVVDDRSEHSLNFTLKARKSNDMPYINDRQFRFDFESSPTDPTALKEVHLTPLGAVSPSNKVSHALSEAEEGLSSDAIAHAVDLSQKQVQRILRSLEHNGRAHAEKHGRRVLWFLTD